MSDMLELNCWLLGEDPPRIFIVEIAKAKTIYGLKRAAIKDMKTVFDGIDADLLKLWKVNITDLYSLDTINGKGHIPGEGLGPLSQLSNVFTDRPERERLHITVVQHPDDESFQSQISVPPNELVFTRFWNQTPPFSTFTSIFGGEGKIYLSSIVSRPVVIGGGG